MAYIVLLAILGAFLLIDLLWINNAPADGITHTQASSKLPLIWSGICAASAIAFGLALIPAYNLGWVGTLSGGDACLQFLTAWLVEQSLSIDNVFVMAVILGYFKVPLRQHHRVLMLGILGAVIMRGICIYVGSALLQQFSWMNYIFAALLLLAAWKLWRLEEGTFNPADSSFYRIACRILPITEYFDDGKFVTRINGKMVFTRLAVVLLLIEVTDLMFAFDSIPAVFAISSDPFIVFSSNMFAILNLRSLYSVLSVLLERFSGLKTGLIGVLAFIGVKMALTGTFHIPTWISSLIIIGMLASGLLLSRSKSAPKHGPVIK